MKKVLSLLAAVFLLSACCPKGNEAVSWCESRGGRLIVNASEQILCVTPEGKIISNPGGQDG